MHRLPAALHGGSCPTYCPEDYSRLSAALKKYIIARQSMTPYGAPLVALAPFLVRHALSTPQLQDIISHLWMQGEIVQAVPNHFAVVYTARITV